MPSVSACLHFPLHVNFGPYPVGASVLDVTVLRRPMVLDAATKARMN